MKVLWFTNIPMPAVDRYTKLPTRGSGHWMSALLEKLAMLQNIKLGVVTAYPRLSDIKFESEGVDYFVVGQPRLFSDIHWHRDLKKCAEIAKEWKPDLIHIHGTENFYGLLKARALVDIPTAISIQGLRGGPYSKWTSHFGSLSAREIVKSHRLIEILAYGGLIWDYLRGKKAAKRELEIIRGNNAFIGRTDWDRAYIRSLNPAADYYHVDELLRTPFYEAKWNLAKCRRHSIIFTNAGHPRRGTETLLEAVKILRGEFKKVQLSLVGTISERSGYGRFLRKSLSQPSFKDYVKLLGYLDANKMVSELVSSHVFVIASHIENSPNSLCEAMLVGMPCIASYTGGTTSMLKNEKTGLFFPPGDAAALAECIRKIFNDDAFANQIAAQAKTQAVARHDPEHIIEQLINAYNNVIRNNSHRHPYSTKSISTPAFANSTTCE